MPWSKSRLSRIVSDFWPRLKNWTSAHRFSLFLFGIIFASLMFFASLHTPYFHSDDWYHLNVVQISSVGEFLNFFNPWPNPQQISFYRPIPTQLLFFTFYKVFGLTATPFFILFLFLQGLSCWLFARILRNLRFSNKTILLAVAFYAFSHIHFARLNFFSAGQEIVMVTFFLLGVLSSFQEQTWRRTLSLGGFFILALMSKESAIIFPAVIGILELAQFHKIRRSTWLSFGILGVIALAYIGMRVFIFGFDHTIDAGSQSYQLNFSPRQTLNTLYFYVIWTLGAPELLKDSLLSPLQLSPKFTQDFGQAGWRVIWLALLSAALFGLHLIIKAKKNAQFLLTAGILFGLTLLPFIFFPNHKFTLQLVLPVMIFAAVVGKTFEHKRLWHSVIFLAPLIFLNILSTRLTQIGHYVVQRAEISRQSIQYFQTNYPNKIPGRDLYVTNSPGAGADIAEWGSSMQVSHALMQSNFIQVLWQDRTYTMYYEDLTSRQSLEMQNSAENSVEIPTKELKP